MGNTQDSPKSLPKDQGDSKYTYDKSKLGQHTGDDVMRPNLGNDVVVIPVGTGKESLRAFRWYVEHLHHTGNRVFILHCCEVEQPSGIHDPDYSIPPEQWDEKLTYCREASTKVLGPYEKLMENHSIHGSTCTRIGRPGKTILDLAHETDASMIVMGSRGLGPVAKKLLGSVSEYVVKKSKIPVTVVPPPEKMDLLWYILH